MTKNITILFFHEKNSFEIFENYGKGMRKWEELSGVKDLPMGEWLKKPVPFSIVNINLKHYYGTVWVATKWNKENDAVHYFAKGRWKDIKYLKDDGYKIKKIVLEEFKEPEPYRMPTDEEVQKAKEGTPLV